MQSSSILPYNGENPTKHSTTNTRSSAGKYDEVAQFQILTCSNRIQNDTFCSEGSTENKLEEHHHDLSKFFKFL